MLNKILNGTSLIANSLSLLGGNSKAWDVMILEENKNNCPLIIDNLKIDGTKFSVSQIDDDVNIEYDSFSNVRMHGKTFLSNFKKNRKIKFRLKIKGIDKIEFEKNYMELRKTLAKKQIMLIQNLETFSQYIIGTVKNMPNNIEHYNTNRIPLDVEIETTSAFWIDSQKRQGNLFNNFSGTGNLNYLFQGSGDFSPVIHIYFKENTNLEDFKIQIDDTFIQINQTLENADYLKIDYENKEIFLNDEIIDYVGTFGFITPDSRIKIITEDEYLADILIAGPIHYV